MSILFFEIGHPKQGYSFQEFSDNTKKYLETTDPTKLDEKELKHYEYRRLNVHRVQRILKTYAPDEELKNLIKEIDSKQYWMILTEDWCGDSAQNLPYIYKMSMLNENIVLRIFRRDENPELMNKYLTNGSRSIPKLIAFDENGTELFQWGPRPKEAQELVKQLIADNVSKPERNEKLHLWYARNRGQNIENEFKEIFRNVTVSVYN